MDISEAKSIVRDSSFEFPSNHKIPSYLIEALRKYNAISIYSTNGILIRQFRETQDDLIGHYDGLFKNAVQIINLPNREFLQRELNLKFRSACIGFELYYGERSINDYRNFDEKYKKDS